MSPQASPNDGQENSQNINGYSDIALLCMRQGSSKGSSTTQHNANNDISSNNSEDNDCAFATADDTNDVLMEEENEMDSPEEDALMDKENEERRPDSNTVPPPPDPDTYTEPPPPGYESFFPKLDCKSNSLLKEVMQGKVRYTPCELEGAANIFPADIEMLHALKNKPLYLFNDMQKLKCADRLQVKTDVFERYGIADADILAQDRILEQPLTRAGVLSHITEMYGMQNCVPIIRDIKLPYTGVTTQIVTFNFKESAKTLLTDPLLTQSDNLLLPEDSPFGPLLALNWTSLMTLTVGQSTKKPTSIFARTGIRTY